MFDKDNKFGFISNNNNNNEFNNSDIKKYVDDKITIKTLPVDVNKNYCTNVADLEPHSIYMSPNDAKLLYLAYEKLSGTIVGFCFSSKPHGRFIYTGDKDDTKIEIMIDGRCYTVHFKTDTVDGYVEKTVFYLTKNNTIEYTPTADYEPSTKKYVDDNTPIRNFPVNDTTRTGAVVDVNNLTVSGRYVLPKRTDGKQWTNLMMRAMINDGSGKGKSLLLSGYQNYIFYVNIENKKIYCDNLRIVYNIGTTDDTTDIRTEPYFLPTTNTKEFTPTKEYHPATKKYVDDNRDYYFKVPTILYDDTKLPKGYVDITTLEQGINYRVNSSIVSGFFKVSLKAPNDDGTWFTVDDGSNTIGWSSMLSTSICVQLKSDTFIAINMNCINNYCKYLSITKENGKWKLMQTKLDSISPDNTYKYDVTNDYNPAHKKYVDDKVSSLPQFSFNENGELVVKIGDTTKIFVPKE